MSARVGRRAVALGLAAVLGGCGFHPLYAPGGTQEAAMGAVFVDIIPNRSGQLLRQALQQRLEGSFTAGAKRYVLSVYYVEAVEGLGILANNFSTRTRDIGSATWSLHRSNSPTAQIAGGTVRSVDGNNTINNQFFYSDLSQDATEGRLTDALADQIAQALAAYFRKHPELA